MSQKKGFTLIEVIVVILIIAIISVLAVPSFRKTLITNRQEKVKAGLVEFTTAVQLYNADNRDEPLGNDNSGAIFDNTMYQKFVEIENGKTINKYLSQPKRWASTTGGYMTLKEVTKKSDSSGTISVIDCKFWTFGPKSGSDYITCVSCDNLGDKGAYFAISRYDPTRVIKLKEEDAAFCRG